MKNRCIHTEKVMKEYHYAVLLDYYRKLIVPFIIIFLFILINFIRKLINHDIGALTVFDMAAPVILIGVLIVKLEKVIKLNQQRMRVLYGKTDCESVTEFTGVIINNMENKNRRELSYNHLLKYIETKNLIILIFAGRIFIPLDKNGFTEGDAESFRKFINSKIK